MIDPHNKKLSLLRQCKLLRLTRSSIYYKPRPIKSEDLELMQLIDEQYMKTPIMVAVQ
jgi:putative transposase